MESRKKASRTLMQRIRNDTTHADVELVLKRGVVLTAHAVVLSSASDYYKGALSTKWTHRSAVNAVKCPNAAKDNMDLALALISRRRRTSATPTVTNITFNHPNVDSETAKIVLDFLYLGDVEIPPSLILSVIEFADEILVLNLVRKIPALEKRKSYAVSKMMVDLRLSLQCGGKVLARLNEREVEALLLFQQLAPTDRWRILIAWCKVCQNAEGDLSLESNLPPGFQIEAASKLIEPLLPLVELFKIPANSPLLEPFMVLLPKPVQDMPVFHMKGRMPSGRVQWNTTPQHSMDITHTIKDNLPVPSSSQLSSDPVLLFHGKEGAYTNSQLHKAYDGKTNTLTLINLKSGSVCAAFSAAALAGQLIFRQGSTSSMFLTAPSGSYYCFCEPVVGLNFDFRVEGHVLTARKRQDDQNDKEAHGGDDEDDSDHEKEVYKGPVCGWRGKQRN
ncbi:hypothetical protein HDU81_006712 [Chytriomyces hyalinus]|nr:hypothetical protein HDU81_006712 [Chytriomyces hyalinus]